MIAPSEKHLEQYIWDHPTVLGEFQDDIPEAGIKAGDPELELLWRQYPLPSGIVDLVAKDWRLWIIELKKGTIDARAVVQVLRYMADMRRMWDALLWDYYENREYRYTLVHEHDITNGSYYDQLVHGLLIGHDVKDPDLYTACEEANVTILQYRFYGNKYVIDGGFGPEPTVTSEQVRESENERKQTLLSSGIGKVARDLLRLEFTTRKPKIFSAADAADDYLNELDGGEA